MLKRLLIIGVIIVTFWGKSAWEDYQSHERIRGELRKRMPALHSMSDKGIANSDCAYSGSLGELTLHFEPKGKLTFDVDGAIKTGRWEVIGDSGLNILFADSEKMASAVFRTSTDELIGLSLEWTATRVR